MGKVISDAWVQNAWQLGESWRTRRKEKKLHNAMAGMLDDPESSIRQVFEVDPVIGMGLKRTMEQDQAAAAERERLGQERKLKTNMGTLQSIAGFLKEAADDPDADFLTEYDRLGPVLTGTLGLTPDEVQHYRGALAQNPNLLRSLLPDDAKEQFTLGEGQARYDARGNRIATGSPRRAERRVITHADGSTEIVEIPAEGGGLPASPAPASPAPPAGGGGFKVISAPGAVRNGGKRTHRGWDIAPVGEPGWKPTQPFKIVNPRVGTPVTEGGVTYPDGLQGNTADIVFEDGTKVTLMHLAELPKPGSYPAGALAGIAGNTGNARNTPRHFHAEAYDPSGNPIDPTPLFGITGSAAPAGGGAPVRSLYRTQPKPGGGQWRVATAQEKVAAGVDASASYQISPTGEMKLVPKPDASEGSWRPASPDEKLAAGVDPAAPYQISPKGEMKLIGPAPRGKVDLPQQQQARYNNITDGLDRLEQVAVRLRDHKGLERMTGPMSLLPSIPGGAAKDAEAQLATLKSQIAFTILQNMRDMSKTGGALGNVSNYEITALENNIAALNTRQSPEEFKRQLNTIIAYARKSKQRLGEAYNTDTNGKVQPRQPTGAPAIPPAAIAKLKENPSGRNRIFFDQVFGKGAAARVLGK